MTAVTSLNNTQVYNPEIPPSTDNSVEWQNHKVEQINCNQGERLVRVLFYEAILIYGLAVVFFACLPYFVAAGLLGGIGLAAGIKFYDVCEFLGLLDDGPIKYENVSKL